MTHRIKFALMGTAMVAAIGVLQAQVGVTLQLRNGEKLTTSLVDLGAAGFQVQTSGEARTIAKDQVAMVDFGGDPKVEASAFDKMSGADHLVVLKNGSTFLAEWVDVGGTSPLRLSFRTASGDRDLTSNDVARIYLVKPAKVDATPTTNDDPVNSGAQADGSIAVMATQPWTDTGLTVRAGQMIQFEVTRRIKIGTAANDEITADGISSREGRAIPRILPVRELPMGGLIGRVGSGQPFAIGTAPQPIRMPANGRLWLGINDLDFAGHSGHFRVVVR